ncbi:hypothetical protein [Variovorax boronicumulans]|uniref:hypothetical protein n=1 Tax=Variovorax boronicumulans TaxID=436515 RepID=UPI0033990B23
MHKPIGSGRLDAPVERSTDFVMQDRSIVTRTREVTFKSTKVDQLTHELAQHKRLRFGKSGEKPE